MDYPSNSNKSKEKKEVNILFSDDDVLSPKAAVVKEDADSIKNYLKKDIFEDVIAPSLKRTAIDIFRNVMDGFRRTLEDGFIALIDRDGKVGPGYTYSRPSYQDPYRYRSVSERRSPRGNRAQSTEERHNTVSTTKTSGGFQNIVFPTEDEAKSAFDNFIDQFEDAGCVTIMDLYSAAGTSSDNYMYNKYGWIDISNAKIIPVSGGYSIKLSRPIYLS